MAHGQVLPSSGGLVLVGQDKLAGFILNLAFTGAVSDKARNPAVPCSTDEIVQDARTAAASGFAMGHFHVRDESGQATNDPRRYAELFAALRADPATRDMVVIASTSGRHGQSLEERAAVLSLPPAIRPDMASLTLSSMNFPGGPSINSPEVIRALARAMRDNGVRPELEVFDLGMVSFLRCLIAEGLVEPPYFVNFILGNQSGAQADALSVGALVAGMPAGAIISLGGIGAAQGAAHLLALAVGQGLRTGLEDNFRLPGKRDLASNGDMAAHAGALLRWAGREPATAAEVRRRLGLTAGPA